MATPEIKKRVEKALEHSEFIDVRISELNIDHSYQRELNMSLVQRIAASWNPVAGEPVLVSRRKSGKLYVVNGQHRVSAKKILGAEMILGRVVNGLETAGEAELRLITNVQISERPNERFKAQLAANYEESHEILRIIVTHGVELNLDRVDPLAGLNAIATIEMIYRIDRGQTLEWVITLLSDLYKEVTSVNSGQPVLRAFAWFYTRHEAEYNREWLIKALREMPPAAWAKQSKDLHTLMGGSQWINYYRKLIEAYNEAAPDGGALQMQTRGSTRMPRADEEEVTA
jgi:hypothetical protein